VHLRGRGVDLRRDGGCEAGEDRNGGDDTFQVA
jgi:hypothetical protein